MSVRRAPTAPVVQLGPDLSLPIDLATEAIAILGRRGRGKTNTAGVIAEEFITHGVPVCVVDTVGVWWGLRLEHELGSAGQAAR